MSFEWTVRSDTDMYYKIYLEAETYLFKIRSFLYHFVTSVICWSHFRKLWHKASMAAFKKRIQAWNEDRKKFSINLITVIGRRIYINCTITSSLPYWTTWVWFCTPPVLCLCVLSNTIWNISTLRRHHHHRCLLRAFSPSFFLFFLFFLSLHLRSPR